MARPWFPFYFTDFLSKTDHLTLVERGAYVMLMGHYYKTSSKLPANAKQLIRICKAFDPQEVEAMENVLAEFFVKTDEGYTHSRIEEEINKSKYISEIRSQAGKEGSKKKANAKANARNNKANAKANTEANEVAIANTTHNSQLKPSISETEILNLIPDDYKPDQNFIDRMRMQGITKTIIEQQTEIFIAHHQAKKTVSGDFDAEFKSWLVRGKVNGWHKQGENKNEAHKHNDEKSAGELAIESHERKIREQNLDS